MLYLEGRGVTARARRVRRDSRGLAACVSLRGRARWIEMASPRPRTDGSDTFFIGPAPEGDAVPLDARDPRNHNLFLLGDGEMDLDV